MLDGQGRIVVWREEKASLQFNRTEMYSFCIKKGKNVISFRINVKCFVLALLHTRQMLESYVIIGWNFFLIASILGPFFSFPFLKQRHFEKKQKNQKSPISKHKSFVFSFGISTIKHFVSDCIEMQCFDILLCGCRAKCLA